MSSSSVKVTALEQFLKVKLSSDLEYELEKSSSDDTTLFVTFCSYNFVVVCRGENDIEIFVVDDDEDDGSSWSAQYYAQKYLGQTNTHDGVLELLNTDFTKNPVRLMNKTRLHMMMG